MLKGGDSSSYSMLPAIPPAPRPRGHPGAEPPTNSLVYTKFARKPTVSSTNPLDAARRLPAIPPAEQPMSTSAIEPELRGSSMSRMADAAVPTSVDASAAHQGRVAAVDPGPWTLDPGPPGDATGPRTLDPGPSGDAEDEEAVAEGFTSNAPVGVSDGDAPAPAPAPARPRKSSLWAKKRGVAQMTLQHRLLLEAKRRIKLREAQLKKRSNSEVRAAASKGGGGGGIMPKARINFGSVVASLVRNKRAVDALRHCPTFAGLGDLQLSMLAYGGVPASLRRYSALYREGAASQSFYILLKGSVQLVPEEGAEQTLVVKGGTGGVCFGLESLNGAVRRQATVTAIEHSELLAFSIKDMTLDADGLSGLATRVFAEVAENALRRTPLFGDLEISTLFGIAPLCVLETVDPDTPVFSCGDLCESMYILLNGSVEVLKDGATIAHLDGSVNAVGDGHPFFGEADALEGLYTSGGPSRRPWSVHARTPCSLLALNMRRFRAFLRAERMHDFAVKLDDYSDTRRRGWELSSGLKLEAYTEPDPPPAPAPAPNASNSPKTLQRSLRGNLAVGAAVTKGGVAAVAHIAHAHNRRRGSASGAGGRRGSASGGKMAGPPA